MAEASVKSWLMTASGRLSVVSWLEGASLLVLVAVAMPMKYVFDRPELVSAVGRIHGLLFVVFCIVVSRHAVEHGWGPRRVALAFVASVVPGGAFVFERWARHGLRDS